jgi:hypothetical protein
MDLAVDTCFRVDARKFEPHVACDAVEMKPVFAAM